MDFHGVRKNKNIPWSFHLPQIKQRMKKYSQSTLPERYAISAYYKAGQDPSQIVLAIGPYIG